MPNQPHSYDQVVYLMQGGGALGTYQVGVISALMEHDIAPHWLIGVSIGAINAAIIAGNEPAEHIQKLKSFWKTIASPIPPIPKNHLNRTMQELEKGMSALWTMTFGQPDFFKPRFPSPLLGMADYPDQISFYDISELRETLLKHINFHLINQNKVRLTLSAYCIEAGKTIYFDSAKETLTVEHVMASSALPPGFPAVSIAGRHYWDGGITSNTPMNAILAEDLKETVLCISMHLFAPHERVPASLLEVLKLKKEVEYASRYHEVMHYLYEIKRLHNALHRLTEGLPNLGEKAKEIYEITALIQPIVIRIVRFHYEDDPTNLWTKDFEFSPQSLEEHYEQGYQDTKEALKNPYWLHDMPENGIEMNDF